MYTHRTKGLKAIEICYVFTQHTNNLPNMWNSITVCGWWQAGSQEGRWFLYPGVETIEIWTRIYHSRLLPWGSDAQPDVNHGDDRKVNSSAMMAVCSCNRNKWKWVSYNGGSNSSILTSCFLAAKSAWLMLIIYVGPPSIPADPLSYHVSYQSILLLVVKNVTW